VPGLGVVQASMKRTSSMKKFSAFIACLFAFLAPGASAQGLAQLMVKGEVVEPAGGWCQIVAVAQEERAEPRTMTLAFLAARGTSAADLVALCAARLDAAGIRAIRAPLAGATTGAAQAPSTLFIERCARLEVRLPLGLSSSLAVSEAAPRTVKLVPATGTTGSLHVHALRRDRLDGAVAGVSFQVAFNEKSGKDDLATALAAAAIDKGWRGEVVGREAWTPGAMLDGSQLLGASFELLGGPGATLEIALAPRE